MEEQECDKNKGTRRNYRVTTTLVDEFYIRFKGLSREIFSSHGTVLPARAAGRIQEFPTCRPHLNMFSIWYSQFK